MNRSFEPKSVKSNEARAVPNLVISITTQQRGAILISVLVYCSSAGASTDSTRSGLLVGA